MLSVAEIEGPACTATASPNEELLHHGLLDLVQKYDGSAILFRDGSLWTTDRQESHRVDGLYTAIVSWGSSFVALDHNGALWRVSGSDQVRAKLAEHVVNVIAQDVVVLRKDDGSVWRLAETGESVQINADAKAIAFTGFQKLLVLQTNRQLFEYELNYSARFFDGFARDVVPGRIPGRWVGEGFDALVPQPGDGSWDTDDAILRRTNGTWAVYRRGELSTLAKGGEIRRIFGDVRLDVDGALAVATHIGGSPFKRIGCAITNVDKIGNDIVAGLRADGSLLIWRGNPLKRYGGMDFTSTPPAEVAQNVAALPVRLGNDGWLILKTDGRWWFSKDFSAESLSALQAAGGGIAVE